LKENIIGRWIKIFLVLLALVGAIAFLVSIGDLVKVLVISALLAYVLDSVVTRFESYGLGRTAATALLFVVLATVLGIAFATIMPFIRSELVELGDGITPEKTQLLIARVDTAVKNLLALVGLKDLSLSAKIAESLVSFSSSLFNNLLNVLSILTSVLLIPFIVFFFLKDGRSIKKYLISLAPNRYFELTCNMLYKMDVQLGNYFRGQVIDALIIGILSIIALWILGIKYAAFIGIVAGIANLVPYIGPIIGALTAMVISFINTGDPWLIFYIAVAFGIVQLVDNTVVQPAVVARNVNLPPLVVLLVVIIGGKFFGVLGMLLSVPLTAALKVFMEEGVKIYRKYRLA